MSLLSQDHCIDHSHMSAPRMLFYDISEADFADDSREGAGFLLPSLSIFSEFIESPLGNYLYNFVAACGAA